MDTKTLCLGALTMGAASGYEIKKKLEGSFRRFYEASYGSIYPALARLQADGLVSSVEMPQDGRPDKRVYSLTPAGRDKLAADLGEPLLPDRIRSEFMVAMVFSALLPERTLSQLIDERLERYDEDIAFLESRGEEDLPPGRRLIRGYGLAIYRAGRQYLAEHRHLVERAAGRAAAD